MVGHQLQTHARVGLSTGELPVGGGRIPTDMTPLKVIRWRQRVTDPSAFLPVFSSKTLSCPLPPKPQPPHLRAQAPQGLASWRHSAPQCSRAVECCAACCLSAAAYLSPSKRARLCAGSSTSSCGVGAEEQVRPAGCFWLLSSLSQELSSGPTEGPRVELLPALRAGHTPGRPDGCVPAPAGAAAHCS